MTATTQGGFDSVSQAGSDDTWTGLSNMAYPTEGEGSVTLNPVYDALFGSWLGRSNVMSLTVPHDMPNIPTGAEFSSMEIYWSVKKTGGTTTWYCGTNLSSSGAFSVVQTTNGSYEPSSQSGDKAYWNLGAYSGAQIIDRLKDGSLSVIWRAAITSSGDTTAKMKTATVIINYVTTSGERAAVIAAMI